MSPRKAAAVIAAVVLAVGVAVGFWPHTIPLGYTDTHGATTMSCGSAFAPDDSGADDATLGRHLRTALLGDELTPSAEEYQAQCSDALASPRIIAFVLSGIAVLGLLFLTLTNSPAEKAAARDDTQDDDLVDET